MAITTTKIDSHWNYFLSVEADLLELSRFIEFDKRNYKCFSVEMARLLMAAAAEVDVVCKQLCLVATLPHKPAVSTSTEKR